MIQKIPMDQQLQLDAGLEKLGVQGILEIIWTTIMLIVQYQG